MHVSPFLEAWELFMTVLVFHGQESEHYRALKLPTDKSLKCVTSELLSPGHGVIVTIIAINAQSQST